MKDVEITVKKNESHAHSDNSYTYSHPSYGMIRVHRQSSSHPTPLFGAEVESNSQIAITIEQAEVTQDLGRNWYYGHDRIVEVLMSPVQYAEMISNPNTNGSPCTIKFTNKTGHINYKPIETQTQYVESKIESQISELKQKCRTIQSASNEILSQKGPLKKADKEKLSELIQKLSQTVISDIPFYEQSLNESIEKLKSEARAEVDSYVSHAITKAGIKTLNNPEALSLLLQDSNENE